MKKLFFTAMAVSLLGNVANAQFIRPKAAPLNVNIINTNADYGNIDIGLSDPGSPVVLAGWQATMFQICLNRADATVLQVAQYYNVVAANYPNEAGQIKSYYTYRCAAQNSLGAGHFNNYYIYYPTWCPVCPR